MKTATRFLLLFFFFQNSILLADHLAGGHINYTCLGDNQFEIELIIYRDCNSDGAPFEPEISLAVYTGNSDTQVYNFQSFNFVQVSNIYLLSPQQCDINPSGICLEYARYNYTSLTLPPPPSSTDSYFFVYQRCCRDHESTNLMNSEQQGITVFTEITPESLASCNSSPSFNIANPVQVCLGEPFTIEDLFAEDIDADSIAYELCKPFVGGGPVGTPDFPGDPQSCDGVIPTPACPPPYSFVEYNSGYDEFTPLGISSTLNINHLNGIVSGLGQEVGLFTVGVCAKEYRDGQLLSSSVRDFVIEVVGLASTSDIEQPNWAIFPQPTSDHIFIKTDNGFPTKATLRLFDSQGALVSEHSLDNSTTQRIQANHLRAGLHFYQIQKEGLTLQSGKLLKL